MASNKFSQKLNKLAEILEAEYSTPRFRECTDKNKEYDKSRYLYTWFAFNVLNTPRIIIRDTLPCYGYGKTIYQVIRRMYLRRKDKMLTLEINHIKRLYGL